MAITQIMPFISEKNFSGAIDLLISNYREIQLEYKESFDSVLSIISFWKSHESSYPRYSYEDIYTLWQEFNDYVIKEKLFDDEGISDVIRESVMADIYNLMSPLGISPSDPRPFLEKIIYAKTLLNSSHANTAFSFISQMIKKYPSEPETWALMGKLYAPFDRKKSILFYREAFFIDPSLLNLNDIRSSFIDDVLKYYTNNISSYSNTKEKEVFLHWLGICGVLGGFFKSKKQLTTEEESILSKRIIVYENRYYKNSHKEPADLANLLRLYLFKYDYYKNLDDNPFISDILKKIEALSPLVYSKLMK